MSGARHSVLRPSGLRTFAALAVEKFVAAAEPGPNASSVDAKAGMSADGLARRLVSTLPCNHPVNRPSVLPLGHLASKPFKYGRFRQICRLPQSLAHLLGYRGLIRRRGSLCRRRIPASPPRPPPLGSGRTSGNPCASLELARIAARSDSSDNGRRHSRLNALNPAMNALKFVEGSTTWL